MIQAVKKWLVASPQHLAYTGVALALLLTLPFGGLEAVSEEEKPPVEAGTEVSFAPWTATFEKAIWGPELGGVFRPLDGAQHLVVLGTLRTTEAVDETLLATELGTGSIVVRAEGIELLDGYGNPLKEGRVPSGMSLLYTTEPSTEMLTALAPGLTYQVALHLTTDAAQVPDTIELELAAKSRRMSSLEDIMLWTDPVHSATVVVPTERSGPVFKSVWELEQ